MKNLRRILVIASILLLPAAAFAKWYPVHHIESDKPLYIADGQTGKWYKAELGYSVSSWQETTKQSFSHAVGIGGGNLYEFRMVSQTANDFDSIEGLWDVYRNGVLVCGSCVGKAYGLSGAVGDYFKIYVGTPLAYAELWHFSAYIVHRFDY